VIARAVLVLLVCLPAVVPAMQGRGGGRGGRGGGEKPEAEGDLSRFYFEVADWDADGWIYMSEAEKSLGIDKAGFRAFDRDGDGSISPDEFAARYQSVIEKGGVFTPPNPKPETNKTARKGPRELLRLHDADGDGLLVESEIAQALSAAQLSDPTPEVVLATLDKDKSNGLEGAEIEEFVRILSPDARPVAPRKPKTLEQLFGRAEERSTRASATIGPPRIAGPVPVYARLDFDQSGAVGLSDLEELQRPLQSAVRAPAVLATIDANGDGSISALEFAESMRTGDPLR
jgi:Ca2+-binding EF-hand superfamily protein